MDGRDERAPRSASQVRSWLIKPYWEELPRGPNESALQRCNGVSDGASEIQVLSD